MLLVSAGHYADHRSKYLDVDLLKKELCQVASDSQLFPQLNNTLPAIWIEIEELITTLREQVKQLNGPQYRTVEELEKWLYLQNEDFKDDSDRKGTLDDVLDYLVSLGKVVQFKQINELKHIVFLEATWLITLLKDVVRHDLETHLQYKDDYKAYNLDSICFDQDKDDLVKRGMLSESLLKCVWHDKVPRELDLSPLLQYFNIGYKMTKQEAEMEGKEIRKNYTIIPALMSTNPPKPVDHVWQSSAPVHHQEIKCLYVFHSSVPTGLFELLMALSHNDADYTLHWRRGFFGIYNMKETEEVNFCVIRQKDDVIEVTVRAGQKACLCNSHWKAIMNLHLIFADVVNKMWPELRYAIYNYCPSCNKCHHPLDFEMLMKFPKGSSKKLVCKNESKGIPDVVQKDLVYPSKG